MTPAAAEVCVKDVSDLRAAAAAMRRLMAAGILDADWDEHAARLETLGKAVHRRYAEQRASGGCAGCRKAAAAAAAAAAHVPSPV